MVKSILRTKAFLNTSSCQSVPSPKDPTLGKGMVSAFAAKASLANNAYSVALSKGISLVVC